MIEMTPAIERVDVGLLRVPLVAGAAVDDHPAPCAFDHERAHREQDPAAVVWRCFLFPEWTRHDTTHRATVETEEPVIDAGQLEVAPRHPLRRQVWTRAGGFLQLHEYAVRRRRMNKRHQCAFGAGPRLLVHQPDAALSELRERGANVVHSQGDVVNARTALVDVLRDRRTWR